VNYEIIHFCVLAIFYVLFCGIPDGKGAACNAKKQYRQQNESNSTCKKYCNVLFIHNILSKGYLLNYTVKSRFLSSVIIKL